MSESNSVKEVTCKYRRRKVPAGKFCSECGEKIATESRDGATNEEPSRPPIQASDALLVHSTKASRIYGITIRVWYIPYAYGMDGYTIRVWYSAPRHVLGKMLIFMFCNFLMKL